MKIKVRIEQEIKIDNNDKTLCSISCNFLSEESNCLLFRSKLKYDNSCYSYRCNECLRSEIKIRPNIITGA
ncbi:MAG: hypothetical protein V1901_04375 [Patescibacteria group bacterium]